MQYPANAFAFIVFFSWPIVTAVFFAKYRASLAVSLTIIAGSLLLPERLELVIPGFPPMTKYSWVNVCALIGCLVTTRGAFRRVSPATWVLVGLFAICWVGTVLTNLDPLRVGVKVVQGLDLSALKFYILVDLIWIAIPLAIGQAVFRTLDDLRDLLKVLVGGAIVYTPFMLFELRMSPQLHNWFYGYHAHDFIQAVRGTGFRPTVFLNHGLGVAKLMHEGIVIALALRVLRQKMFGRSFGFWALWLLLLLILSKSVASLVYALLCGALILLVSAKNQMRVALLLLFVVGTYPVLRAKDWFPTDILLELATKKNVRDASEDRAGSLRFRFQNEDQLMAWAMHKPYFGWGGHGRNRVYNPATGFDKSVTDGTWIILIGTRGATGSFLWLALLAMPILALRKRILRSRDPTERTVLAALGLLLATSWIDLLPNAGPMGYLLLLTGATLGVARGGARPSFAPGMDPRAFSPGVARV